MVYSACTCCENLSQIGLSVLEIYGLKVCEFLDPKQNDGTIGFNLVCFCSSWFLLRLHGGDRGGSVALWLCLKHEYRIFSKTTLWLLHRQGIYCTDIKAFFCVFFIATNSTTTLKMPQFFALENKFPSVTGMKIRKKYASFSYIFNTIIFKNKRN